jgi:hypothetical protein
VLWDNVGKYGKAREATGDNIIRHMLVVCWKTKATNTHLEYVILIAFPLQQCLPERASVLGYTYIVCFNICLCLKFLKFKLLSFGIVSCEKLLIFIIVHNIFRRPFLLIREGIFMEKKNHCFSSVEYSQICRTICKICLYVRLYTWSNSRTSELM